VSSSLPSKPGCGTYVGFGGLIVLVADIPAVNELDGTTGEVDVELGFSGARRPATSIRRGP
jgi:hypothetical protein